MRVFGFLGGRKTVKWEIERDIVLQILLPFTGFFCGVVKALSSSLIRFRYTIFLLGAVAEVGLKAS
jgi:hypothetical protein